MSQHQVYGPPPGQPVSSTRDAHSHEQFVAPPVQPTFLETLDACSQWTAIADELAAAGVDGTETLAQGVAIMASPGLSWFKRRNLRKLHEAARVSLNVVYNQHSQAIVQIQNLTASLETAITARTPDELYYAMIGAPVLPVVRSNLILAYDEAARFIGVAALEKTTRRNTEMITGSLTITDRRLLFESDDGITESALANIMRVAWSITWPSRPYFIVTGKGMSQKFFSCDAVRAAVIIDMLVRMQHRYVVPTAEHASRVIPQQVKVAVYQRDRGRCVQCGSDQYLEYDHVIPWSKGGASSVENLQLLCRKCNALKGDRL